MKKMSREERNKWLERGKTVLICFLCFCCVYLLLNVIEFYKEQISISSFFGGPEIQSYQGESNENTMENVMNVYWHLSEPELVMACNRENRQIISRADDNFSELTQSINLIMHEIYSGESSEVSESNEAQWRSALENNAVYVRYDCQRFSDFEADFYDVDGSEFEKKVSSYSELLFVPNMSSDEGVTVFARVIEDGSIVKVNLTSDSTVFKNVIKGQDEGKKYEYTFAYELNLDADSMNNEDDDATTLSSMFLIPIESMVVENVIVSTPRVYKNGINFSDATRVTTELINLVGYNPNTVRQYANNDGAVIFVSETGSLSLHQEGKIEYRALGENEGVPLNVSGSEKDSAYSIISGISEIINKIFSICGYEDERTDATLKITQFPNGNDETACIKLDYFVDEYKLMIQDESAITATVKDGVLTELRMWVKTIEKDDEKSECEDVFVAIDKYCQEHPTENKNISGKPVYLYDKNNKKASVVWKIQGDR